MLQEHSGHGAVELVFVITMMVADGEIEPVQIPCGPVCQFGGNVSRDVSTEKGCDRCRNKQTPVSCVKACRSVDISFVSVEHFQGVVIADGTYANEVAKGSGGNACYYELGSGKGGVTVEGNVEDPSKVVIDVSGNDQGLRLFLIQGAGVIIKGVTIKNFKCNLDTSPVIRAASGAKNFTLSDCVFVNIVKSNGNGSVLTASDTGVIVGNCQFIACTNTVGVGGAIYMEQDNKVTGCFFKDCCASAKGESKGIGGAIYVNDGKLDQSGIYNHIQL